MGLIQHRNGPHSAMGRCLQQNEHKGQLWCYSPQGRRQRAPGTVEGFVGRGTKYEACFSKRPLIRFTIGDSTAAICLPGCQVLDLHLLYLPALTERRADKWLSGAEFLPFIYLSVYSGFPQWESVKVKKSPYSLLVIRHKICTVNYQKKGSFLGSNKTRPKPRGITELKLYCYSCDWN